MSKPQMLRPLIGRKASGKHAYEDGKPCPTCYAPMTRNGHSGWYCTTHGLPTKP